MNESPVTLGPFQSLTIGFGIIIVVFIVQIYSIKYSNSITTSGTKQKESSLFKRVLRYSFGWAFAIPITIIFLKLINAKIFYSQLIILPILSVIFYWYEARKPRKA